MKYWFANVMLMLLPATRLFGLKRFILRKLGISLGKRSKICGSVQFFGAGKVIIGDDCWIGLHTRFYTAIGADIFIGDRCDIAPETSFVTGSHILGGAHRRAGEGTAKSIKIGSGTWIGARSLFLGGADIGGSSVIGANSMVREGELAPNHLAVGSPAKVFRKLE